MKEACLERLKVEQDLLSERKGQLPWRLSHFGPRTCSAPICAMGRHRTIVCVNLARTSLHHPLSFTPLAQAEWHSPNQLIAHAPHILLLLQPLPHHSHDRLDQPRQLANVRALRADELGLAPGRAEHLRERSFDGDFEFVQDREERGGDAVEEDLSFGGEGDAVLEVGVDLLLQTFFELRRVC